MPKNRGKIDLAICLGLLLAVAAIYARTGGFSFVNYDDDLYVYENPHVQAGLTGAGLKWAMTAVVSSNWMPVTLVSHMLDAQLFGAQSGPQHLMNALIHALSAVLLFWVLLRATEARWQSAFVAFVFAAHPLHVGSVAWIAERKDVLSALFWFAGMLAWVRYAEKPSAGRYGAVAGLFALGLMSKPMLVTFPFALMLFDVWPLRRFEWPKAVVEKLPLMAMSAAASAVSFLVQSSAGAVQAIPLGVRLENALISCCVYVWQTFAPARLSVFYPYAKSIEVWEVAGAGLVIAGVSAAVVRLWRRYPFLAVGWFWFLGTLVPVIGLVQVGMQAHADRYTYLPMIGLTVMVAWMAPRNRIAGALGAAVCLACVPLSMAEAGYWRNSETLFTRAIAVTSDNWLAEYDLGHYLMNEPGRVAEAIPHFEAALRILPDYPDANNNLGTCLMNLGRNDEAIRHFEAALRAKPGYADAHYNLGLVLMRDPARVTEAVKEFETALRLDPELEQAHNSLGVLLAQTGRTEEALGHLRAAVRLKPDYQAELNLGVVLASVPGRRAEAIGHLRESVRLKPDARVSALIEGLGR